MKKQFSVLIHKLDLEKNNIFCTNLMLTADNLDELKHYCNGIIESADIHNITKALCEQLDNNVRVIVNESRSTKIQGGLLHIDYCVRLNLTSWGVARKSHENLVNKYHFASHYLCYGVDEIVVYQLNVTEVGYEEQA